MFYFSNNNVYSDVIKCGQNIGNSSMGSLDQLSNKCNTSKALVANMEISASLKKQTEAKLAKKLADQIKNTSEDLAQLSSYFQINNKDIMMNNKEVAKSCQLKNIAQIENCGGKKKSSNHVERLKSLKSYLPDNSKSQYSNDKSLYGIIAAKFVDDLGIRNSENENSCPLNIDNSKYYLESQLDDFSAKEIVNNIKNSKTDIDQTLHALSLKYPQIKMIYELDAKSKNKFVSIINSVDEESNYIGTINSYLFDEKNQINLSKSIVSQCKNMNNNINKFLCSDLEQYGSLDDQVSSELYNGLRATELLEDQYDVDDTDKIVMVAYGLQCLRKQNISKNNVNDDSIDNWYRDFKKNTRPIPNTEESKNLTNLFCDQYVCKDKEIINTNSCKNNGRLSSEDLLASYGCNLSPRSDKCTENILQSASYIKNLIMINNIAKDEMPNKSDNPTSDLKKSGRLSNFAENFLGIEGSLIALGKPTTPIMLASKEQDFVSRNLETTTPPYKTPEQERTETKKANIAANENYNDYTVNNQPIMPYVPTREAPPLPLPSTIPNPQTINNPIAVNTDKESKELKEVLDELKKLETEKVTTEKELAKNTNEQNKKASGITTTVATNKSLKAEEERLRKRAKDLDTRARDLDEYKRELDERNYRSTSSYSPEKSNASTYAPVTGTGGAGSGMGSVVSSGKQDKKTSPGAALATNAPVLSSKLTPSNPKTEQRPETAALIQSGKETQAISTEELARISPEALKTLGIDTSKPFTLRVNFENQTYEIPVKTIAYKGNNILGPVINPLNRGLKDFLLKGPLFAPYVAYRMERESFLDASYRN